MFAVLNSQEYLKKKPTYLLALILERRSRALTDSERASDVRVVFFVLHASEWSDAGWMHLGHTKDHPNAAEMC